MSAATQPPPVAIAVHLIASADDRTIHINAATSTPSEMTASAPEVDHRDHPVLPSGKGEQERGHQVTHRRYAQHDPCDRDYPERSGRPGRPGVTHFGARIVRLTF